MLVLVIGDPDRVKTKAPTHWIVTATVSVVENVSSASSSSLAFPVPPSSIMALHWICFTNITQPYNIPEDTIGCCNTIYEAVQQQSELKWLQDWHAENDDDDDDMDFVRYCQRKRAVIPSTVRSTITTTNKTLSLALDARFSLLVNHNRHNIILNDTSIYANNESRLLVFDSQTGRSLWKNGHYNQGSQLSFPYLLGDDFSDSPPDDLSPHQQQNPTSHCKIQSQLSDSGGLHRTFHHRITCNYTPTLPVVTDIAVHGRIRVVLWIPQDMWLDANDAFPDPYDTCHVLSKERSTVNVTCRAMITLGNSDDNNTGEHDAVPEEVMDIEDTAFDSPQHVILLHIELSLRGPVFMDPAEHATTLSSTTTTNDKEESKTIILELEVTNKIHLRYPQPILRRHDTTIQPWRRVIFPAPSIYRISWDDATLATWFDVNQTMTTTTAPVMVTFVAAAYGDDYFWVMATTMACSILGSIVLLRDILLASQWT